MKDTILTKWQPSLIHTLLITYQRPLTPALWWDLHGPFMGQGDWGERWRKGRRRRGGGKWRGGESVNKSERRRGRDADMWRQWMMGRSQKEAEERDWNKWQINDEWKDWRRPIIPKKKTREPDRKISSNDPLRRRRTKMAFNLHVGSLGDTIMMRMAWNAVLNTGSGLIKEWAFVKSGLGLQPLKE